MKRQKLTVLAIAVAVMAIVLTGCPEPTGGGGGGTAPVYGISLDQTGTHTFPAATAGYAALTPKTVTIANTGNRATGALTIALSGADSASFTLSATTVDSIAASGTGSFTVVPNTGLTAATYTATVTVSGGSVTAQSFTVSFTVNPPPGTAGITINAFVSEDGNLMTNAGSATISRSAGNTLTVTAAAGLTGIQWSLNGADISGGQSITFRAVDYPAGTYNLGLRVLKGGVPYSTNLAFTVTN